MFPYSPKKNKAKAIPEYSTLYPDTNSASASGRSKGCRFVSAKADTKNLLLIGNNGLAYHTSFCATTISVRFADPAHLKTETTMNPIETSYETICAADRKAPKNAYFEFDDHPAIIIPYTAKDEIANL